MTIANGSSKMGNGHANGKSVTEQPKTSRTSTKRKGFVAWTLSTVARLATWFTILTILFRCPPSLDACDESSPFVCQYYFQARDIISPHVQPYYDRYAAPYVDVALPYVDTLNTNVITPTRAYAAQHGAPWLDKAWVYGQSQWAKNGQPQVLRVQTAAQDQYDQLIAPHLATAVQSAQPYYASASSHAQRMFHDFMLPGYRIVQPYATRSYQVASDFTTQTALPTTYWAWNRTYAFLDTSVLPQLRIIYMESVEPQLVRIGERLGRYKTQVKSKSTGQPGSSEKAESSFSKPAPNSRTPSTTVPEPTHDDVDFGANPVEAPPATENESEKRKKAREMVSSDLELWQTKFAARADEGARDMEDRIDEIAKDMIVSKARTTGQPLVDKLEMLVKTQLEQLKEQILAAVAKAGESTEEAEEEATQAVRSAGVAIKEEAQAVRKWHQAYDQELQMTVIKAADVHFQILDETRNLALQQIGMKWAWTDGVTYKDWAKYHELKKTLQEWTIQLKQLIASHPSLLEAQDASAEVEDQSMEIAAEAARELARLKKVAHWKIVAKDTTDNFESEAMMLAAEQAESTAQADEIEESVTDHSEEDPATALSQVDSSTPMVIDEAGDISSVSSVVGTAVEMAAELATDESDLSSLPAEDTASDVTDEETDVSVVSEDPEATESSDTADKIVDIHDTMEGTTSPVAGFASIASDEKSNTIGDDSGDPGHATSEISSAVEVQTDETKISSTLNAEETEIGAANVEESIDVDGDDTVEPQDTKTDSTTTVKPAMFGAAAQSVSERKPVLDDYDEDNASVAFSNAVNAASEQYSSAVSVVSAQIYGTPKPVHQELFSSVSAAYDNAMAAASSRFSQVVATASGIAKGTAAKPTPTSLVDWGKVESIAAQRLNEGRLWAEVQYQSAVIALGLATPTPTSSTEKYLEEAKKNYYAGIGLAQERYSSFITAASSAMFSLTATPTPTNFAGTASSVASAAKESAASAIKAAQDAAESAYEAATGNVASAVQAVDDGIVSVFDAASQQVYLTGSQVAETWDNVISDLNRRIYGEQKHIGWYDGFSKEPDSGERDSPASTVSSEMSKQYEAVSKLVSELITGKEPSFTESVLNRLSGVYATATSNVGAYASDAGQAAAAVGDKVSRAMSHATDVIKETMHIDRDEL